MLAKDFFTLLLSIYANAEYQTEPDYKLSRMTDHHLIAAHQKLVHKALPRWGIAADAKLQLLNFSENTTFAITSNTQRYVIRVHRPSYNSRIMIASELAWMQALDHDGALKTATIYTGLDGETIQAQGAEDIPEHLMVLFAFIEGIEPKMGDDLFSLFQQLGNFAARSHLHSMRWQKPTFFRRHHWDVETILGASPLFGRWQDGPGVTPEIAAILQRAENIIKKRLTDYGKNHNNYGLIHADMRLANLLVADQETRIIDFDDCGYSWWMQDYANAISFHEDHPQVPELKRAWLEGYTRVKPLSDEDIAIMDTLSAMRRLQLLGWIGSRQDNLVAPTLSHDFAERTAMIFQVMK